MATTPDTAATSAPSDEQLAAAMHKELKVLLDAVPGARRVLPHLAVVETTLKTDGLPGIDWLPLAALEKACTQLANLPLKPESTMLPQLLSLMNLAINARNARHHGGHPEQFLSSFLTDDKLLVSEASHTDFVQLQGKEPAQQKA